MKEKYINPKQIVSVEIEDFKHEHKIKWLPEIKPTWWNGGRKAGFYSNGFVEFYCCDSAATEFKKSHVAHGIELYEKPQVTVNYSDQSSTAKWFDSLNEAREYAKQFYNEEFIKIN